MQIIRLLKTVFRHNPSLFLFIIAMGMICSFLFGYYFMGKTFLLLFAGLIGVIVVSVTLLRWPFVGLLIILIVTPAEELMVFPGKRTAIFALGVVVMFFWLIHILRRKENIRIAKQPTLLIILLFCLGLASFFWAKDGSVVLARVVNLINLLLFYILFQDLVKNNKRLKIVLFTLFITGIIYSLITVGIELQTHVQRVGLTKIQNPNHLAMSLIIGFLVTPYILKTLKSHFLKIITILGILVSIVAIIMTGSRGAWVGLVIAFVLTFLIIKSKVIRPRNLIIIGIIIVIFIFALYQTGVISQYTVKRITTITDIRENRGGAGRLNIWKVGLEMIKYNPIIGVGLNNFSVRFENYIAPADMEGKYHMYPGCGPHNMFLSIQGELGIIGLVLFLLFFWTTFKSLLPHRQDPRAIIGILLLTFIFFTGITGTIQYTKSFWIAISIATLIPMIIRNEKKYERN